MTREIKFRVWNGKEMYNPNTIYIKNGCITGERNETLMQYTGLKDKDGKEIYEGDIVKLHRGILEYNPDNYVIQSDYPLLTMVSKYPHLVTVIGNIYENSELLNKHE